MKARIFTMFSLIVSMAVLLAVLPGATVPAVAQEPEPPGPAKSLPGPRPVPGSSPYQTPDGLWVMPDGAVPPTGDRSLASLATGGPDDFGYTWDDWVPFVWVDATSGTDTGMSGDSYGQAVGPISLPFSFKFYENTYASLYVAASGYLGFTDDGYWPWQPRVPSPAAPNNIIAPYATPLDLATTGPANRVYYKSGGAAPNRFFVVEWYQTEFDVERYTFEVILHENGDIVFQYQTMTCNDVCPCGAAGIEDSLGVDGLVYVDFCQRAPSWKAVRFYRPAPSARVSIHPLYQGRFTHSGETVSFEMSIRNTGEFGADTYDISAFSSSFWPLGLYAADGATPISDTDSDGTVDTGSVAQGSSVTVTVQITTPTGAAVGDHSSTVITARSSLDTSKSSMPILQTAVPASFAQIYRDDADDAMGLYLVQPAAQAVKKATSDWHWGHGMAVAEMPDSFAYFWSRYDWTGDVMREEIEYTLLDRYGETTRAVTRLTDHSGATMSTYDYDPAVAVAPNGRIGVLWYRDLDDYSTGTSRSLYNVYFAVLDASGNVVAPPTNITNNNDWYQWDPVTYNVPQFYDPRIAATGDNRFVLAWTRDHQESAGRVDDIYYAIRDANGAEVGAITRLTNDTAGSDTRYKAPALASLSSNRVFLSWFRGEGANDDIYYAVVGSDGTLVRAATDLSVDETVVEWNNWDAVQLSDGKILAVWEAWGCFPGEWVPRIRFALLDTSYNRMGTPACLGKAEAAVTGDVGVSVAADDAGHAILTWMDSDYDYRRNLYYALVDGSGSVLTDPMIFRTAGPTDWARSIETSFEGYGNTSYSCVDGMAAFSPSQFFAPPGFNAALSVHCANHGARTASGVVLTATLDSDLTYVSDTSGVGHTVSGNDVVWSLPDLGLWDSQDFTVFVQVPSGAAYGTRYPLTLTLTSDGPEANPADNIDSAEVMAARQVFLPVVLRGY